MVSLDERKSFRLEKRTFVITADDIQNSIDRDSKHCPIAEAISRTLPGVINVSVDLGTIRWSDPKKRLRYIFLTPRDAAQFIVDIDSGNRDRLKPYTLTLRPPVQVLEIRSRQPSVQKRSPRKKRVNVQPNGVVTVVGGNPLPTNGNLQRKRLFGARALVP